ncbi:MAG: YhjD/YihY/BrkB family envelope integrity protein [Verrucomicrobiota bacterium]
MNFKALMKYRWIDLLKRAGEDWMEDKALRLSAALAYYSIFSIAPLLVITIGMAGLVLGEEAVSGRLYGDLKGHVGAATAEALQSMVKSANKPAQGVVATVTGFAMLLLGASGVFGQLKDALNTIWEVESKGRAGVMGMLRDKLLNFGMVLAIGFLLLVSLLMSSAIAGLNDGIATAMPMSAVVGTAISFVVSLGIVTALFALIFKVLPDARIGWRDVWVGAALTALLFEIGKTGLGWYLGRESTASAFGAAGSIVLLLLWVYYTSCILFFGAEFTQVYAQDRGRVIEPAANARKVSAVARAQQGMTPTKEPDNRPDAEPTSQPSPGRLRGMIAPVLGYLEARGLLASIEAREALQHLIWLGIALAAAVVAAFAGWLLLATALVGWLTGIFGWSWVKAAGITGGAHVVAALAMALLMRQRLRKTLWFTNTLNELKQDRSWLKEKTTSN